MSNTRRLRIKHAAKLIGLILLAIVFSWLVYMSIGERKMEEGRN